MVKLNSDLISRALKYVNAVKDYQLDLRGYKISIIENLSATNDQFGSIDLSDNSISKVEELNSLNRLRSLLLINNRITYIENDFAINCPKLENLILTNNKISDIEVIDNISSCKTLLRLSLVNNLVTKLKYYRLYVIYKMPNLRVLDFQKVKKIEKEEAMRLFESEEGEKIIENIRNKNFSEDDKEFKKGLENIKNNEKVNRIIADKIKNTNNYEDLMNIKKKITTGEIVDEIKKEEDEKEKEKEKENEIEIENENEKEDKKKRKGKAKSKGKGRKKK